MLLTGEYFLGAIGLVCGLLLLLLQLYYRHKFSYWRKRGVPYAEPTSLFGNFKNCLLQRECVGQFMQRMYNEGAGKPFYGTYVVTRPALVLRDPDLIKTILVKDFNTFYERNARSNHKTDPLSQNLFLLKGPAWRILRAKMTPIFTSLRLKQMFPLVSTCAENLKNYIDQYCTNGKPVEMKESAAKYSTDVVTTCAFGIESNCLMDPNAEFRRFGRQVFEFSAYRSFEFMASFMLPFVVKLMNVKFFSSETTNFLKKAFWDTIREREEKNIQREDIMQLLIQLKNEDAKANGVAPHNRVSKGAAQEDVLVLKGDILVAQAAIFFIAGFESQATTIAVTLYELAMQPHLQTRLRNEILDVIKKNQGKLPYEDVRDMEYMHMVVSESLRKVPVLPILDRVAGTDYVIPGTNITIEKGTTVYVPLLGLHMDPDVYPDPDRYDPERFSEEKRKTRHPYMYLPFGEGPKYCLGKTLGLVSVKTALANILANFEVLTCAESPKRIQLDPKAMILAVAGGIRLKFTKLKH